MKSQAEWGMGFLSLNKIKLYTMLYRTIKTQHWDKSNQIRSWSLGHQQLVGFQPCNMRASCSVNHKHKQKDWDHFTFKHEKHRGIVIWIGCVHTWAMPERLQVASLRTALTRIRSAWRFPQARLQIPVNPRWLENTPAIIGGFSELETSISGWLIRLPRPWDSHDSKWVNLR